MDTWAIFIDIEGFSDLLISDRGQAAFLMRELANGIHRIGSRVFPGESERLFAYGLGDGFLIVPDYSKQTVEKPLAISIVLLHYILEQGGVAKASISKGETADVSGWFTDPVRACNMGHGLIISYPIMGSALINAFNLGKTCSGSILVLDSSYVPEIPEGVQLAESDPPLVDWINSKFSLLQNVASQSEIPLLPPDEAKNLLRTYIKNQDNLPTKWISNTLESTGSNGF